MSLWENLRGQRAEERGALASLTSYIKMLNENPFWGGSSLTLGSKQEEIEQTFGGFVTQLFEANPIIFGCVMRRMQLFSEVRFQYRDRKTRNLFGDASLGRLENPWEGATTRTLLKEMALDGDLAGNWFGVNRPGERMMRLRPDWVKVILGGRGYGDPQAVPVGYIYFPGGYGVGEPEYFIANEVAHFKPIPDPIFPWRGISWLRPVIREAMADKASTEHKLKYLEEGAVPSTVVKNSADISPEDFGAFVELFQEKHGGLDNKFATYFLGGGADMEVIGSDLKQVDFKAVQAIGENRLCIAAGVPGIIVGVSEGLEAATYSNYQSARRQFADGTMQDLWGSAADALSKLVKAPGGADLWFDDRYISYLQDDQKDRAEVQSKQAVTISLLVKEGYTPESVVAAVTGNDMGLLVHSGLISVQLQEPGASADPAQTNGNGSKALLPA